ncbi:MAG TPA: TonB-dependent receptor [Oleiagrimonas sp.]|nr:TonB-dependent receptor [Oleiagrimonas sp.]
MPLAYAIRNALVLGVSLSLGAVALEPALASPAPQQAADNAAAQQKKDDVTSLQAVQVTGSHIPRTEIVTSRPVVTIGRQQIDSTGLQTVGQILQELPSITPTMNAAFNFEGNGASHINLRNLGARRTLILVNGKRWVTSINGTTDLNSIPLSAVDRIQVLKSGASAVYGSDAIAGVVNIILKKHMNGGHASVYYGIWHGNGHWGGLTKKYSFTFGHQAENYGFLFNAEYSHNRRIPAINRVFSATPVPHTGVTRGSSSTPQGRFEFIAPTLDNPNNPNVAPAPYTGLTSVQCPARNYGTAANPRWLPFCDLTVIPGTAGTSASDFRQFQGSDRYNWTEPAGHSKGDSILNPLTIKAAYMSGHYDITDKIRFTASLNYAQRNTKTYSAPNLMTLSHEATIAASQKYNPFNFTISNQPVVVAPTGGANGGPLKMPTLSFIGRRLAEFPERVRIYESDSMRFTTGLNGLFNTGDIYWHWDTGFQYMTLRNKEMQSAGTLGPNFNLAVGDAATCASNPECVPLNLFGGQGVDGNGSITPAQVAYLYYPEHYSNGTTQRIVHLNLATGNLFELPAGPVGFAVGYQYNTIEGYFNPDAITAAGLAQGSAKTYPTRGGYHVNAFYTEFKVPLLSDVPGAYRLNMDVAARHSKYNTFSGSTRLNVGVKWLPVQDLAIRLNWGQGFRAPNISELFTAQNINNPTVFDPCSGYTKPGVNPTVAANCAAAGVPGGYLQPDQQIRTLAGGNRHLDAETSTAEQAGFVYSPHQLPGLSFSATYYRIKIENSIQPYGPNNILEACYIAGAQKFCNAIHRSPLGTINQIDNLQTNIGSTSTSGVDLGASYRNLQTSFGRFHFSMHASHTIYFTQRLPLAGGVKTVNLVGIERAGYTFPLSVPSWKAVLNVGWRLGDWGASWRVHYTSALMESCSDNYDGTPISLTALGLCNRPSSKSDALSMNRLAPVVWHDARVVYHAPFDMNFTLGVNNIFDKKPPNETQPIQDLAFDPTQYAALMGRFIYARVDYKF